MYTGFDNNMINAKWKIFLRLAVFFTCVLVVNSQVVSAADVETIRPISFGTMLVLGADTIKIYAKDGEATPTSLGGTTDITGGYSGIIRVTPNKADQTIQINPFPISIDLTREGGTEVITFDDIANNSTDPLLFVTSVPVDFNIGGCLNLINNMEGGVYSGTVEISITFQN